MARRLTKLEEEAEKRTRLNKPVTCPEPDAQNPEPHKLSPGQQYYLNEERRMKVADALSEVGNMVVNARARGEDRVEVPSRLIADCKKELEKRGCKFKNTHPMKTTLIFGNAFDLSNPAPLPEEPEVPETDEPPVTEPDDEPEPPEEVEPPVTEPEDE